MTLKLYDKENERNCETYELGDAMSEADEMTLIGALGIGDNDATLETLTEIAFRMPDGSGDAVTLLRIKDDFEEMVEPVLEVA